MLLVMGFKVIHAHARPSLSFLSMYKDVALRHCSSTYLFATILPTMMITESLPLQMSPSLLEESPWSQCLFTEID